MYDQVLALQPRDVAAATIAALAGAAGGGTEGGNATDDAVIAIVKRLLAELPPQLSASEAGKHTFQVRRPPSARTRARESSRRVPAANNPPRWTRRAVSWTH